jgi:hypothetical protein
MVCTLSLARTSATTTRFCEVSRAKKPLNCSMRDLPKTRIKSPVNDDSPSPKPSLCWMNSPTKSTHDTPTTQEDTASQHIPLETAQPQYKLGQQVWSQGFIAMTNGQVLGRDATCHITHIYDIRHIDFNIKGDHYQPKNIAYAIQATLADEPLLPRQLYAFEYELRAEQPPAPTVVQTILSPEMQRQAKQRRQLQAEDRAKIESFGIQIHPAPETPATQEDTSSATYPRSNYPRRRSPATYPHH